MYFDIGLAEPIRFNLTEANEMLKLETEKYGKILCSEIIDFVQTELTIGFYRAMHFSAKRGIAIACRLSVCL